MEEVVERTDTELSAVVPNLILEMRRATMRICGCWHRKMSRPFTRGKESYRTCVACGARRRFDLEHFKMFGSFYYAEIRLPLYDNMR